MSTQTAHGSGLSTAANRPIPTRPRQLWQVPVFFTGVLAMAFVASAPSLRQEDPGQKFERDLDSLRRSLAQRQVALDELVPLAEQLSASSEQFPHKAGVAQFLVGTVFLRKAERGSVPRAAELRQNALFHLEWAQKLGVPVADQSHLWYRLGKLHFQLGSDIKRTIDYLMRSGGSEEPVQCYGMLVQAHLRLPTPDVDAALAANLKQIEHADDETVLGPARLLRAELLVKKNQRAEALKVLERIGPTAPRPLYLKARALQARTCMEDGLWAKAIPQWQELLDDPSVVPGGKARILYSLGLCYCQLDPKDVTAENTWHAAAKCGGEEGQAAAFKLAEIQLRSPNPAGALEHFQRALEKVSGVGDYRNTLLELPKVFELFELGFQICSSRADKEQLHQLADLYRKLAPSGGAEERLAHAAQAHAQALRVKAQQGGADAAALEEQARAEFVSAGNNFVHAADLRKSGEYAEQFWRGITCYLQAPDHAKAIIALQRYVTLAPTPEHLAEAWFALAGSCYAIKQADDARKAYYECIKTPGGTFVSRALYHLALLEIDAKNLVGAEKNLDQILKMTTSSADRAAHEESLFKLADLLFQQRKYDDAQVRYKQAIQQYPNNANILQVRDQLATCYRRLAEQIKEDLERNAKEPPERRWPAAKLADLRSTQWDWLSQAQKAYQDLADDLELRAKAAALSAQNQDLLRKAALLSADCLLELPNNVAEALRRYKELAQRYGQQLEGLISAARLCECYRLATITGDAKVAETAGEEARSAVATALANLPRMSPTVFEGPPGTWSREQWAAWFNDASRRLK